MEKRVEKEGTMKGKWKRRERGREKEEMGRRW